MRVAGLLGQQALALETIVLAQLDTQGLGSPHQCGTHLVIQAGVGRKGDRLFPSGTLVVATPSWPAPPGSSPPTTSPVARHRPASATCSSSTGRSAVRAACTGSRRRTASTGSLPSGPLPI